MITNYCIVLCLTDFVTYMYQHFFMDFIFILLNFFSWMDAEALNTLTPKMIGTRPNTYTYTKSIAEVLLKEEYGTLPVAIFRPSIVGATYQEPVRVGLKKSTLTF